MSITSSLTSPVTRETTAFVRDRGLRKVCVTVTGGVIEFRAKGLKTREVLDIASLYEQAVKQRVADEKATKRAARGKR